MVSKNPYQLAQNWIVGACLLALASGAQATMSTITGSLLEVKKDNALVGSTVDHLKFAVASSSMASIDVLSWEANASMDEPVDVNGDGEIAFFDSRIYLFRDDGSLDASDYIADNDDGGALGYGDGSVSALDSFLSRLLAPGNYILAIGAAELLESEAIAGANDEVGNPFTCSSATGACDFLHNGHGDYRITFNIQSVPEPASLALLASGMAAMGGRRKRTAG
jgi:hypothetical protein